MSVDDKRTLTKSLNDLLGFDDGAEDVLEHLLSIESGEDLLDYLCQLLGQEAENVKSFVDEVGKFQRGEPLSGASISENESMKPPATKSRQEQDNYMRSTTAPKGTIASSQKPKPQGNGKQKPLPAKKNLAVSGAIKTPPAAAAAAVTVVGTKSKGQGNDSLKKSAPPFNKANNNKALQIESKKLSEKASTTQQGPPEKSHPPKGTATITCGCFGGIHKALTNCLYCGRISCSKEGYGFCPFCGMLVEPVEPPENGAAQDEAWLHKERLLRFDRDFARRTVIFDDQADYYSNSTSTWLTEEEKESAKEQEEKREKDLHQRKKQTMDIVF